MPNRIDPIRCAVLYAMLPVIVLPNGSARAADDCLSTPNSQPPQGSHWYYRVDGATQRHCWYLGPEGQKVHRAEPEMQQAAQSAALVRTETSGGRLMASTRVEPQVPRLPPATAANAIAQAGVQGTTREVRQGTASTVRWPDPQQLAGASGSEAGGAATLQDVNAKDEMIRPAAIATNARTNLPIRVTLLVASALAVAGIFQRAIFGIMVAPRRRTYVGPGRAERSVSLGLERMPAAFAAPCSTGPKRAPIEQVDPQYIEERFPRILRTVERRAA